MKKALKEELERIELDIQREEASKAVAELRLKSICDRLTTLRKALIEACPHETTEDHTSYLSGSYYDRAATLHNLKCVRCGKSLKSWEKTHSWYG